MKKIDTLRPLDVGGVETNVVSLGAYREKLAERTRSATAQALQVKPEDSFPEDPTTKTALAKREGGKNETATENMYAGYFAMLKHNRQNREAFRQALMGFLLTHGIAMAKRAYLPDKKEPDKFMRFENVDQKTLAEIDKDIWAVIGSVEKKLFRMLKKQNCSFEEVQKYLLQKYKLQVTSWNDFYDKIEGVVEKIIPVTKAEKRAA